MRLYDITVPLQPTMHTYHADPPFRRVETQSLDRGDDLTLSRLEMGSHSGTHVDAPSHFIRGAPTLDQLPLETFVGTARVVDSTGVSGGIDEGDVEGHRPRKGQILLFKTSNSERWTLDPAFFRDYVHLTPEAAKVLVRVGVKAVGIDYLSVEAFDAPGAPVHKILLSQPVGIIEGLDLSRVSPGKYQLYCLPLRVSGSEGAPARAVLVEE